MTNVLWVALGGAIGAVARYALSTWVASRWAPDFPWATLGINLSGSLALGFLYGLAQERVPEAVRLGVGVGVLGAYTTFSTFELEVLQLTQRDQALTAAAYIVGGVVGGFLAAWAGWSLARGR